MNYAYIFETFVPIAQLQFPHPMNRKQRNEWTTNVMRWTEMNRKTARQVSRGTFVPPKMCAVTVR